MRDAGSASAAAVADAVVAAEKPAPCRMRNTTKGATSWVNRGPTVPTMSTANPKSITMRRPRPSISGPESRRTTAAAPENTAAKTPAYAAVPP